MSRMDGSMFHISQRSSFSLRRISIKHASQKEGPSVFEAQSNQDGRLGSALNILDGDGDSVSSKIASWKASVQL